MDVLGKMQGLTNFPVLERCPLVALNVNADSPKSGEQYHGLDAVLLSLVVLWLCSPVQECHDILGHLGRCCRGACTWKVNINTGCQRQYHELH